jgi:hypothetical protein
LVISTYLYGRRWQWLGAICLVGGVSPLIWLAELHLRHQGLTPPAGQRNYSGLRVKADADSGLGETTQALASVAQQPGTSAVQGMPPRMGCGSRVVSQDHAGAVATATMQAPWLARHCEI